MAEDLFACEVAGRVMCALVRFDNIMHWPLAIVGNAGQVDKAARACNALSLSFSLAAFLVRGGT